MKSHGSLRSSEKPPLDPILIQLTLIRTHVQFSKIHLINFTIEAMHEFLISVIHSTCTAPLILLHSIVLTLLGNLSCVTQIENVRIFKEIHFASTRIEISPHLNTG
jgi:hypothetical protein